MYSKKVMEIFKNPKHMGEIKNPDSVGRVGNPTCLVYDERIHVNDSLIEISNASTKHQTIGQNGIYNDIYQVIKRRHNGKIISLHNQLGKVCLTPEHLILSIKVPKTDKFRRIKNKRTLNATWYHASDLQKGDIVLYPILQSVQDQNTIKVDVRKSRWDFRSKAIPNEVPLNEEFLRLSGYFLSEGSVRDEPSKSYTQFSLHIGEEHIAQDIGNICNNLFSLNIKATKDPKGNSLNVFVYNTHLARFLKNLFGTGAEQKRIPHFMMLLPPEKQQHLIIGLWRGDGYVNVNRNGPRAGYSTISYQLAHQIKTLLLRQKISPSMYTEDKRRKGGVAHKKNYRIHVGQRESLSRLYAILDVDYCPLSYTSVNSWFDGSYLYTPITKVQTQQFSGTVYNLEVGKTHSFTSEAFCLHNCGDVMEVQLRIKESKIRDIKIKTFGCVAAITTASMMADLVKGKPLKEAEELRQDDITKALGGLPPIKRHCSELAIRSLKKAIANYKG